VTGAVTNFSDLAETATPSSAGSAEGREWEREDSDRVSRVCGTPKLPHAAPPLREADEHLSSYSWIVARSLVLV
jgi:hypothetical protein